MIEYPIKTKEQLKEILKIEFSVYIPVTNYRKHSFRYSKSYSIFCALKAFREYEYFRNHLVTWKGWLSRKYYSMKLLLLDRKRNILCEKAGIELTPGQIGPGIRICHANVVIFGKIGEGCVFHGNNVVGNKRTGALNEVPRLGNHVDVGFGACIIGNVEIADNCVIGAGAVVTKSFLVPGTIIAGVPAKIIGQVDNNG